MADIELGYERPSDDESSGDRKRKFKDRKPIREVGLAGAALFAMAAGASAAPAPLPLFERPSVQASHAADSIYSQAQADVVRGKVKDLFGDTREQKIWNRAFTLAESQPDVSFELARRYLEDDRNPITEPTASASAIDMWQYSYVHGSNIAAPTKAIDAERSLRVAKLFRFAADQPGTSERKADLLGNTFLNCVTPLMAYRRSSNAYKEAFALAQFVLDEQAKQFPDSLFGSFQRGRLLVNDFSKIDVGAPGAADERAAIRERVNALAENMKAIPNQKGDRLAIYADLLTDLALVDTSHPDSATRALRAWDDYEREHHPVRTGPVNKAQKIDDISAPLNRAEILAAHGDLDGAEAELAKVFDPNEQFSTDTAELAIIATDIKMLRASAALAVGKDPSAAYSQGRDIITRQLQSGHIVDVADMSGNVETWGREAGLLSGSSPASHDPRSWTQFKASQVFEPIEVPSIVNYKVNFGLF